MLVRIDFGVLSFFCGETDDAARHTTSRRTHPTAAMVQNGERNSLLKSNGAIGDLEAQVRRAPARTLRVSRCARGRKFPPAHLARNTSAPIASTTARSLTLEISPLTTSHSRV